MRGGTEGNYTNSSACRELLAYHRFDKQETVKLVVAHAFEMRYEQWRSRVVLAGKVKLL
jgi:hypothetical protein